MSKNTEPQAPHTIGDNVSRRDLLKLGGAGILGITTGEQAAAQAELKRADQRDIDACLFIVLTGGPSQLETFDPKPSAPAGIRGPFQAISTAVPGVQLSETLPRLAERMDKLTLIRSLHHNAAPNHEAGLQLLQTGRCARGGMNFPALGSMVSAMLGPRNNIAPYHLLPKHLGHTGVRTYQGQTAGILGDDFRPAEGSGAHLASSASASSPYGSTRFAHACYQARELIEEGARFVTVNMFETLDEDPTWDCHGSGTSLSDYREKVCPDFDGTLAALLDDLEDTGLLERTLVVASGEFGRTPRMNAHGGRDHWPSVWSALVAGGPTVGGRVIGASDARGSQPIERPILPGELLATISEAFGVDPSTAITTPDGTEFPVAVNRPLFDLIGRKG